MTVHAQVTLHVRFDEARVRELHAIHHPGVAMITTEAQGSLLVMREVRSMSAVEGVEGVSVQRRTGGPHPLCPCPHCPEGDHDPDRVAEQMARVWWDALRTTAPGWPQLPWADLTYGEQVRFVRTASRVLHTLAAEGVLL